MDQLTSRAEAGHVGVAEICQPPLAITFATNVALMSSAWMLYPVLPVQAGDLAVDEPRIGLVMAAYTGPAIVWAPLFGIIADLHGRRWISSSDLHCSRLRAAPRRWRHRSTGSWSAECCKALP
jgi:hypothetical protein